MIIFAGEIEYKMSCLIDTHTHLYDEAFSADFDETVSRSIAAGVSRFVFPDIDSSSREAMLDCAAKYPDNIFCGISTLR